MPGSTPLSINNDHLVVRFIGMVGNLFSSDPPPTPNLGVKEFSTKIAGALPTGLLFKQTGRIRLTAGTSEILDILGIDKEEFTWEKLSLCNQHDYINTNMFFDEYENSEPVAKMIDDLCLSCPVMALCLKKGVESKAWGVWGGVYLIRGKMAPERNAHKTKKTWDKIKSRLLDDAVL